MQVTEKPDDCWEWHEWQTLDNLPQSVEYLVYNTISFVKNKNITIISSNYSCSSTTLDCILLKEISIHYALS